MHTKSHVSQVGFERIPLRCFISKSKSDRYATEYCMLLIESAPSNDLYIKQSSQTRTAHSPYHIAHTTHEIMLYKLFKSTVKAHLRASVRRLKYQTKEIFR